MTLGELLEKTGDLDLVKGFHILNRSETVVSKATCLFILWAIMQPEKLNNIVKTMTNDIFDSVDNEHLLSLLKTKPKNEIELMERFLGRSLGNELNLFDPETGRRIKMDEL